MNYKYITDFTKSRQARIGASDIPNLIPHPVKQIESLAAYTDDKGKRHPCTALELYENKINGKNYEYSFPAEMGHYLEGKILYEFIKDNIDYNISVNFFQGYQSHKFESEKTNKAVNPGPYNNTPFKHNTEALVDYGVAHADCLYDPTEIDDGSQSIIKNSKIKKSGLIIDLSKPFLIEAKSCNYFALKTRTKDQYKGYDLTLKQWQGVPLATYFQTQYQMYLYDVDVCYLALIYNTNSKYYWQIKRNKKHQKEIVQLASYMKQCIDNKTPPKRLLMNSKDIISLYPEMNKNDFREVTGKELTTLLTIAKEQKHASGQEKLWKNKKNDCTERMSIHLKDTEMIKGIVNDNLQTICKWKKTGGGSYVESLTSIEKREDGKKIMRYLKKNDMIKEKNEGRKPEIKIKGSELE